jgi:hypothetical protein
MSRNIWKDALPTFEVVGDFTYTSSSSSSSSLEEK